MKKVYIAISGSFYDYFITKVFSTRELAEEWIGLENGYNYLIEEYDLDDIVNPNK